MLNRKVIIICLIHKTFIVQMSEPFPKLRPLGESVKTELDMLNYAVKSGLENAAGVNTSDFTKKTDSADLKSDVDKSDDCNGTRTHNHLVRKRKLNHLTKLAK